MREKLERVQRLTLQDRVYDNLKQALMRGKFSPGDVLLIRALAVEMGTSMMPVRDALQRLVAERALRMLPNRSVEVPSTTREEFDLLTALRLQVEGLAAELAAARISEADIERCAELNEAMEQAVSEENGPTVLETNMALHFRVYEATDSAFLVGLIESLWLRIGPLLVVPFHRLYGRSEMFSNGLVHHRELLKALSRRDAAAAGAALRADISDAAGWFVTQYAFPESPSTAAAELAPAASTHARGRV